MSLYSRKYIFLHIFENMSGHTSHYITSHVAHYEPGTTDWYWTYCIDTVFELELPSAIIYAERLYPRGIKKRFRHFS